MLSTRPAAVCDEHSSTINRRRQEARPHQARVAKRPALASCPAVHPSSCICKLTRRCLDWHRIADLCRSDTSTSVGSRLRLRSANRGDLAICSSVTHFGTQAFAVAGPKAWNQLPLHVRAQEQLASNNIQDGTKGTFPFRRISSNCAGTPRPCDDYIMLRRVRNCRRRRCCCC